MKVIAILLLSVSTLAQEPKLSVSQSIALGALSQQSKKNADEAKQIESLFNEINAEFSKANPGFHIDPATVKVVKDKPKAESKPEMLDKKGAKQ